MADRTHPDGTVRIVSHRGLLRRFPVEPLIVEIHEMHAPWQEEADRWAAVRIALAGHATCRYPRRDRRTARWDRPAAAAD